MRECQTCKCCYPDNIKNCPEDGEATTHTLVGDPLLEGKYQLESRLGQGGMGVVYKARHTYLKTSHAIKVILPDLVGNDPQLITRFRQEALAAAAIRHHNVVNVTDYGVVEGKIPFLVMEFVQGESLHDLLVREKRLAPELAVELMSAICMGVGAAHRHGIVHRDLKPLNVMIQADRPMAEAVKILDFGLAKIKSGELLGSFIQAQTTGLMGSPYYMAPEQWADEEPDASSDIYSLGVMLFQMLAGDVPYKGGSIPAIMKKHLDENPPAFADLGVSVPPGVEAAVMHSLEKQRDKRTQSVEALVQELREGILQSTQNQINAAATIPGGLLPVSSLHVLTKPPQSQVYLNNTSVGESQTDGSLMLEGIQSGNHHIRVTKDGFNDWENSVFCDGKPQKVMAELAPKFYNPAFNPAETMKVPQPTIPMGMIEDETVVSSKHLPVGFQQPLENSFTQEKKGFPVLLIIGGLGAFLLLGVFGIGIYWVFFSSGGLTGNTNQPANRNVVPPANTANTAANKQNTPPTASKAEMVLISGGSFKMGRNDGRLEEQPAHDVEVKSFWMDKTEVTNGEYAEFVQETKYREPEHWVNGKPLGGQETMPVIFVSLEDAKAFAAWRSKRDGVEYRLPTEEEWEYAARNGSQADLFPWGVKWEEGKAIIDQPAPKPVGSESGGKNKWGVEDLIGNVWEWTSSVPAAYPGSKLETKKNDVPRVMIRGGAYLSKANGADAITAARRVDFEAGKRDKLLGFRLVRPE
ncbi:MAG TPA: SUMF1/EgtB/PvdO family nonheme iron enzyme [Pyrinomonadaceae bacterium]|nr:SUMF1/EgtB/PvdO family nonheme iron enzyme [Pyrinomonadaceae bacterium]